MNTYNQYISAFDTLIKNNVDLYEDIIKAANIIKDADRVFLIGNGGSQTVCSHLAEDLSKVAGIPAYSLEGAARLTCLANDYGYENIYTEWLKQCDFPHINLRGKTTDVLIAISSSGNSPNIINATKLCNDLYKGTEFLPRIITLSAFSKDNKLNQMGDINIHLPIESYGIAESYHSVILHIILDMIVNKEI